MKKSERMPKGLPNRIGEPYKFTKITSFIRSVVDSLSFSPILFLFITEMSSTIRLQFYPDDEYELVINKIICWKVYTFKTKL